MHVNRREREKHGHLVGADGFQDYLGHETAMQMAFGDLALKNVFFFVSVPK
jgi:hypothetical protein